MPLSPPRSTETVDFSTLAEIVRPVEPTAADRALTFAQFVGSLPVPKSDAEAAGLLATVVRSAREIVS